MSVYIQPALRVLLQGGFATSHFLPFGVFHLLDVFLDESGQILNDGSGSPIDDRVLQLDDLLERVDQLVLERQEASMTKDMDRRDAGGWQVGS